MTRISLTSLTIGIAFSLFSFFISSITVGLLFAAPLLKRSISYDHLMPTLLSNPWFNFSFDCCIYGSVIIGSFMAGWLAKERKVLHSGLIGLICYVLYLAISDGKDARSMGLIMLSLSLLSGFGAFVVGRRKIRC